MKTLIAILALFIGGYLFFKWLVKRSDNQQYKEMKNFDRREEER